MSTYEYNKVLGEWELTTPSTIPLSDLANINTDTFLGRTTAGLGPVEELNIADAKTILDISSVTSTVVAAKISLTNLSATSPIFYNNTTGVISSQVADSTHDGYLTSTDWSTFNSKQATITLTTTGTSGAATLTGATLNIPNYAGGGGSLTNFAESINTAAPNDIIYSAQLIPSGAAADIDFVIAPKGIGAIVSAIPNSISVSGGKRGNYAVDLQLVRSINDQIASSDFSVLIGGTNNKTTGAGSSIVGGNGSTNAGPYAFVAAGHAANISLNGSLSFASGESPTISANYAVAMGNHSTASGIGSFVVGNGGDSNGVTGKVIFGGDFVNLAGNSQIGILSITADTTSAIAKILTSDGNAANSSNILTLKNQQAITFTGLVTAKRQGSTSFASWKIEGALVRGATASTTALSGSVVTTISNTPAWTLALTADTTNGGLKVTFTGAAATNIRVSASLLTSESLYA